MDKTFPFRELTNSKHSRLEEGNLFSHKGKQAPISNDYFSEKKPQQANQIRKNFDKSSQKLDFVPTFQEKEKAGNPYNPQRIDVGTEQLTM